MRFVDFVEVFVPSWSTLTAVASPRVGGRAARRKRYAACSRAPRVPPIIEARGVRKTYRVGPVEVPALQGVDLAIGAGEMVAVMGPSGCGKTTLLNCLSGLDDVDAGEIVVAGKDITRMKDEERTRFRAVQMGFIFQSYNLLPVLTAVENVELPLLVAGVGVRDARRRALESLASVGLDDRAHHKPTELSGGQQQRVTIARSLVNRPAIVWADEPTGNLDTKTGLEVLAIMHKLNRERGQTYVIVTHDAALAGTCDRILRMENGVMVADEKGGAA
jgi:putative ABC transport system ATP-binding protein